MWRLLHRHRTLLAVLGFALSLPVLGHLAVAWLAGLDPPEIDVQRTEVTRDPNGARRMNQSFIHSRSSILEVYLSGTPAQIGYAHARLLYPQMVENEGILLAEFESQVPSWFLQQALLDLAQLRYRNVDEHMSADRLAEIAGGALGFQPDPYRGFFPTFQRFVYLNALYDISLSFEHSPLIGCTTFTLAPSVAKQGEPLLARSFDFEVHDIFDEKKAVFFVRETGKIPFASVAWPGLVGVVSGMNAEGVAVVVHGGRAGAVKSTGEPVVHALRRVLSHAKTSKEAVLLLKEREPMVSHIVVLMDASGEAISVERVPELPLFQRKLSAREVVANHFLGPSAKHEKNQRVLGTTSTLARFQRGKQLLARLPPRAGIEELVRLLRDRRGLNDAPLELGDRNAIDALIATHGVVMNTRRRELWVSEAPHLLGRFVRFELDELLSGELSTASPLLTLPPDPLLSDERFARFPREKQPD